MKKGKSQKNPQKYMVKKEEKTRNFVGKTAKAGHGVAPKKKADGFSHNEHSKHNNHNDIDKAPITEAPEATKTISSTLVFEELSEADFDNFSAHHPLTSFHQTAEWGKLKTGNGWDYICLGLKKEIIPEKHMATSEKTAPKSRNSAREAVMAKKVANSSRLSNSTNSSKESAHPAQSLTSNPAHSNQDATSLGQNSEIVAATLLLSRKVLGNKRIFYAPRGFLIDFNDFHLLSAFVSQLKNYVYNHNGILLKVDPYLSYQQRDLDGQIVERGSNNYQAHKNLLKLGFHHHGFSLHQEDLQPRWIFILETKNKTLDEVRHDFSSKTRQKINTNEKLCITTREIGRDELPKYKAVMESTARRRGFLDRPLAYYQRMYDTFHDKGWIKFTLTEVDVKKLRESYKAEAEALRAKMAARENQFQHGKQKMNEKAYQAKQTADEKAIKKLESSLQDLQATFKNDKEVLGGIVFFTFGNEVLSLFGGAYDKYADFQSAYTTHYWGIKYALDHGYDRYNFYGIEGVFDESNPMYGIYKFKRGYGGEVVELLGEYDLPVRPIYSHLYNAAFNTYHTIKQLKVKLTPKRGVVS